MRILGCSIAVWALSLAVTCTGQSPEYGSVFRDNLDWHWTEDANWLWYSVDATDEMLEHFKVALPDGERTPLFDRQRLEAALIQTWKERIKPKRPTRDVLNAIQVVNWSADTAEVTVLLDGHVFRVDREYIAVLDENATIASSWTRKRRSPSGSDEMVLRIQNQLDVAVTCYWLDSFGEAIEYRSLPPGKTIEQHTFDRHVWSVRSQDGGELVRFQADKQKPRILVNQASVRNFTGFIEDRRQDRAELAAELSHNAPRVFVREHDIWLQQVGETATQVTRDGTEEFEYRRPVLSASGNFIAALKTRRAPERMIHFVEARPSDQVQPKLHSMTYRKPGDAIDESMLVVIDTRTSEIRPVATELLDNAWSLSQLQWMQGQDEEQVACIYNARGHQCVRVLSVEANSGAIRVLVEERSKTFIDYSNKTYLHFLKEDSSFLWTSERTGYNHLYRISADGEQTAVPLTNGDWVVRDVIDVDEERGVIWFSACGVFEDQDPYFRHLGRVDLDGSNLAWITRADGDHRWEFSPEKRWVVATHSRVDLPPITELRDAKTGELVCGLEKADWSSLIESGWTKPIRWSAKGRDGKTDIYGVIVIPRKELQNATGMPVVEKIYAGPHSAHVPKQFSLLRQEHRLADLGFVIVRIDGMGTNHRGKKFHDICYKNLADAGFPDRKLWMRDAAKQFPMMDISRVGIFGGSAGGQNALRALIDHHDFYDVAVADCGCHDNRMDKIWWNEAWMGWPVDESYRASSNVEHAHRLQGDVMLIVGELDRNVDPASTMQVVDALVKADKDFDLVVIPGAGHGAAETSYGSRRRRQFLQEHLLK